jgi:hypothetical protein
LAGLIGRNALYSILPFFPNCQEGVFFVPFAFLVFLEGESRVAERAAVEDELWLVVEDEDEDELWLVVEDASAFAARLAPRIFCRTFRHALC